MPQIILNNLFPLIPRLIFYFYCCSLCVCVFRKPTTMASITQVKWKKANNLFSQEERKGFVHCWYTVLHVKKRLLKKLRTLRVIEIDDRNWYWDFFLLNEIELLSIRIKINWNFHPLILFRWEINKYMCMMDLFVGLKIFFY